MTLCKIKTYFGIFVSPSFGVHMVQYIRMPTGGDTTMKKNTVQCAGNTKAPKKGIIGSLWWVVT